MRVARRVQGLFREAARGRMEVRSRLLEALVAEVPAARRVGSLGLGRLGRGDDKALLWDRLQEERVDAVRIALAVAWVRCGGETEEALECLSRRGAPGLSEKPRFWVDEARGVLDSTPTELRDRLDRDPGGGREVLLQLCAHQWPEDADRIQRVRQAAGRRGEHACLEATGRLGCPLGRSVLVDGLDEMHVDPGRGIGHRRASAEALGRLGLPEAFRPLKRALFAEVGALGSPGAGMGVQFPVRDTVLRALGELQDRRALPLLLSWLGAEAESPLGGLHLPAMEGLWKLGNRAVPGLEAVAHKESGPAARNAQRVLSAVPLPGGG
jgi:hypothetical protein